MKILHSSDWHLGQEFHSYDRTEEHTAFLNQLKQIVADEQPDAMIVSGDIYHNASPSNSVMKLFTDHMLEIQAACPSMKIIITAGNHDSSSRLEITRNVWKKLNVEMIGRIEKEDNDINFDRHIISINNNGTPIGFVVAMPHIFPQSFPLVSEDIPREQRQQAFWQELNNRLNQANPDKLPVVMMAHMAISGSDISGHDESRGGMDYVDINSISVDYDYMALGHIHYPQNINGTRARYCGSPIPVSFDEDYEHSVSIVKINHGCEPQIKTIKIDNPIPIKTIPDVAANFDEVLKSLSKLDGDNKMYVRLHIKFDANVPKLIREQAIEALKDKQARFCTIKWERKQQASSTSISTNFTLDEVLTTSPLEIAKLHYNRINDIDMDQDMINKFNEILSLVNNHNS